MAGGHPVISKGEGLMLYWCEGDKFIGDRTYKVAVTSSDAKLLRLYLWNGANEDKAKKYRVSMLNVTIENFTKTWVKSRGVEREFIPMEFAEPLSPLKVCLS